jgi:fumarate hydratase subunit beta
MFETLQEGKELPIDLKNNIIYYLGPTPAREGSVIGSAGPTTSSRMDKYAPTLLDMGQVGMIGKGKRSKEVIESMVKNQVVYFAAVGGAGALYSGCIESCSVIGFDDLGCESVKELVVKDFPLLVAIDSQGNSLYYK